MIAVQQITHCPGTLSKGYGTYSRTCLNRLFDGRKVHHVLPYDFPLTGTELSESAAQLSISGIQQKFSMVLEKGLLRFAAGGEKGSYILKPIPFLGKNINQMPANEHLTMQIARQVFGIETAENALIFFRNGAPAYITKRFDINPDGSKRAQEDFASLAGKTPYTSGDNYKYSGSYLDFFHLLKTILPIYKIEAPKLFRLILFNYLFSNGDAHWKNFSLFETPMGDYRLSPAYDLLNSRLHISDSDFALQDGLLPPNLRKGKISTQFRVLAESAEISPIQTEKIIETFTSQSDKVKTFIDGSFLDERFKRRYWQDYQRRVKKLTKIL